MHAQSDQTIGFVDSAVDRIVPPAEAGETDPLSVTVETFSEWIVDQTQFKGEIPAAFLYKNDDDPQAVELQAMFAEKGLAETLAHYSGLDVDCETVKLVEQAYQSLK